MGPHYDSEPGRRPSCQDALATGMLPAGCALDDGMGVLFSDGRPQETVAQAPDAHLHRVEPGEDGRASEPTLPCRLLSHA
ncbi:peptidase [Streptomyces sp. NPDC002911]